MLPNALAPIINAVAVNLAQLLVGVMVVEIVFVYPGLGILLIDSVATGNVPVALGAGIIFAVVFIVVNLIADILSVMSNPRILHPAAGKEP